MEALATAGTWRGGVHGVCQEGLTCGMCGGATRARVCVRENWANALGCVRFDASPHASPHARGLAMNVGPCIRGMWVSA